MRKFLERLLNDDSSEIDKLLVNNILIEEKIVAEKEMCHVYYVNPKFVLENISIQDRLRRLEENYRFRKDSSHEPKTGFSHVHVFFNNNEIFAVNKGGTAHHRASRGYQLSKSLFKLMTRTFSDFNIKQVVEYIERDFLRRLDILYS